MPFYQLPVLEEDGFILSQSRAIGRYLSNKFGLAGKSDRDKARADMIVDCLEDMMGKQYKEFIFAKDEETRACSRQFRLWKGCDFAKVDEPRVGTLKDIVETAGTKKFVDESLSVALPALEKLLIENNNGDGYFVGDQLTWADIRWFHAAELIQSMKIDAVISNYPKLNALRQRVGEQPGIKKWLASRPESVY